MDISLLTQTAERAAGCVKVRLPVPYVTASCFTARVDILEKLSFFWLDCFRLLNAVYVNPHVC